MSQPAPQQGSKDLWKRLGSSWQMLTLLIIKVLRRPTSSLPKWKQNIVRFWTPDMMKVYILSLGRRGYMDQQCVLREPDSYRPKVETSPEYRLSEAEIRGFYERGFIGPLTAVSPEEMAVFRRELEAELERPSKTFGRKTVRDRHLDLPLLLDLFRHPAITERLAQLLGPDLLIWRSQVFNQEPGAPPITWHQATTYMHEDYKRPILEPADSDHLFQLTTWIAVDEATVENGCLQFVPGTHHRTYTIKKGASDGFYAAHFQLELDIDPAKVVSMELEPGQFVIFSERTVHGSPGNRSQKRRMGINFRAVLPTTRVYSGQKQHYAMHLQETWDLRNWGVMVLRGEDRHQLNKTFDPDAGAQAAPEASGSRPRSKRKQPTAKAAALPPAAG